MLYKRLTLYLAGTVLAVVTATSFLVSQAQDPLRPAKFMRLKLEPAKKILEGIATEDFELIAKSAQEVQTLTLDEQWSVLQTEEYMHSSAEFQRSVLKIRDAARQKKLDGATLAYMQMTLNCVNCHRELRSHKPSN